MPERNVLGGPLEPCGSEPLTGFYRDGCCSSGPEDLGLHTICAVVTAEFLEHQRMIGVAIVGGGAAGVLAAVHQRRATPDAQITMIDASGRPGTGAAYGTDDPTFLLNVPAPRMSVWPDDPDTLSRGLAAR